MEDELGRTVTRWWFQISFIFTPKIGEDEPILNNIFSNGLVQPPTRLVSRMFPLPPRASQFPRWLWGRKRQQSKETVEGEQKSNQAKLDERLGIS